MAARFSRSGEAGKTAAPLQHPVQQAHTARILKHMAAGEPQRFVDSKGCITPFARQVIVSLFVQLQQLHSQGKAHGNLHSGVVLVTDDGHVELKGTPMNVEDDAEYSSNVYDAAKIVHSLLTGGDQHGARHSDLEDSPLVGMSSMPLAAHLLSQMLSKVAERRPTMEEALNHPCLWTETNICNFLVYVSSYLQDLNKDMTGWSRQLHRCLKEAMHEGHDNWVLGNADFDLKLLRQCQSYRKDISTDNWLHLLRCFRNVYRHYKQLSDQLPAIQHVFGYRQEGAYRYFAARFPKLLITTYGFVQKYCMEDPSFVSGLPVRVHRSKGHHPLTQTHTMQPATAATSQAGISRPRQEVPNAIWPASRLNPDAPCWSDAQVSPPSYASAVKGNRHQTYSLGSNATATSVRTFADIVRAPPNDITPGQASGDADSMVSSSSTSEVSSNMSCSSSSSKLMLRGSSSSSSNSVYSQDSMHASHVSWQPGNQNRRMSHQAVADASRKGSVAALQETAYNAVQRKEAVQRFNYQEATAYGAACIGRCYELGSGDIKNTSCAVDWYYKALRLDGRGSIGQHAQLRIAELQLQQHQSS